MGVLPMSEEEKIINKMRQGKFDELKMTKEDIINSHNLDYILNYAIYAQEEDKSDLEQVIIDSGLPQYIYRYALGVKGCCITKLGLALIDLGEVKTIILFAAHVINDIMDVITDYVLENFSNEAICNYVIEVKSANKNKINLIKIISFLTYKDSAEEILIKLATLFPEIPKSIIEPCIVNSENPQYIYQFAQIYDGNKITLDKTIIKYADYNTLKAYYKDVQGIDKSLIANALIDKKALIDDSANNKKDINKDQISLLDSNYIDPELPFDKPNYVPDIEYFMNEACCMGLVNTYYNYNGAISKQAITDFLLNEMEDYVQYDIYYPFLINDSLTKEQALKLDEISEAYLEEGMVFKYIMKK